MLHKRVTFLTAQQTSSLARILEQLMPRLSPYVVTSNMKDVYHKIKDNKAVGMIETLRALTDLSSLIMRSKKSDEMALVLQRIARLREDLARKPNDQNASKKQQANKNKEKVEAFAKVMRGTGKGFKVLRGSAQFAQTEQTKWVAFEAPFISIPTVVFSLRYKDITYATPVIAGVNTKGFSVRGLSLPPPASNVGFIDYIAVGT